MRRFVPQILALGFVFVIVSACGAHEPTVIATGHGSLSPQQPQAAVGLNGAIHVVFGIGDAVHYSKSSSGKAFVKPKRAFQVPNMSLGMRRGPRIATTNKAIVVTAIGGKTGKGRDGDVLAWHSTDEGKSWKDRPESTIRHDAAREGLHAMALARMERSGVYGSICATKKSEIYASRSVDNGSTWESNIRVYQSPDGSVCECCHPSVIVAKDGLHVMFRNSLAGNRDMYITSSADNGKSFTSARKLGSGSWQLDGCPMDGGMLAANGSGHIETVWRRDRSIYLATDSDTAEVLLGPGEQPWIAATQKGAFIAWTTGRDGNLMLRAPGTEAATVLSSNARDPIVVAADGKGPVVCCWEAKRGDDSQIVVQRLDAAR
ncbi:MAG: sialidase family protein [Planctomycetaceae bacterium]